MVKGFFFHHDITFNWNVLYIPVHMEHITPRVTVIGRPLVLLTLVVVRVGVKVSMFVNSYSIYVHNYRMLIISEIWLGLT